MPTCQYAKPLGIALCATGYTIDLPVFNRLDSLADSAAPCELVTIHGQENPSRPYAPAAFHTFPTPPVRDTERLKKVSMTMP